MTRYEKATKSVCMNLTSSQIAALHSICNNTLEAQPSLRNWVRRVEIGSGVVLPFLPIRTFRLHTVSRFTSDEQCLTETGAVRSFFSSGSTQSVRARHLLSAAGLTSYFKSACSGLSAVFDRFNISPSTPILSLVPNDETWPESSLSAMISFWLKAGHSVHFVDIQNDPAALHKAVNRHNLSHHQQDAELIVFGTSLHHLQVSQWNQQNNAGRPFIKAQRAWCFDTGGTKGRTQTTTHSALSDQIRAWFHDDCRTSILSEYGMCELSSQAYSSHEPHDGVFACAPSLKAFALSHDMKALQPLGQAGFLAFIDFANVDSWPCIISEDLGQSTSISGTEFELLGRAPDATLKGCSLNVRDNFQFTLDVEQGQSNTSRVIAPRTAQLNTPARDAFSPHEVLKHVSLHVWPPSSRIDLEHSLSQNCDKHMVQKLAEKNELAGKKVAIIASANIPISWLYPALHAWLMGADAVHLFLPAIRVEAPISALIRDQITDLVEAINQACKSQFVRVHHHRLLDSAATDQFDHIVVFGSDETVSTIRKNLNSRTKKINFTGLGHFQNGLRHAGLNFRTLAELCMLWLGRGCLTPLVVTAPHTTDPQQEGAFAEKIFQAMCEIKVERMSEYKNARIFGFEPFAHQQNLIEIKTLCAQYKLNVQFHHDAGSGVVVVDLSKAAHIPTEVVNKCLEFGGCGWLNVFPESLGESLPNENPSPSLFDKHQGQTWHEWLTKAEVIGG